MKGLTIQVSPISKKITAVSLFTAAAKLSYSNIYYSFV